MVLEGRDEEWNETGRRLREVDPKRYAQVLAVAKEIVAAYVGAPPDDGYNSLFPSLRLDESSDALA